ncbi:MAG: hypothetical protein M3R00_03815 [Pseudomonadota bacterium]|nr:hypothetical protein [Pseudomonadota bacterium]
MKKAIPEVLLECAKKYNIEIVDADDRVTLLQLHSELRFDVKVQKEQIVALTSVSNGTEWEQQLIDEITHFITNPNVLRNNDELGTDPYSLLFSDAGFLSALSLASPKAALAIITVPVLSKILATLSDEDLAILFGKICTEYPEIASKIFWSGQEGFFVRLRDVIENRADSLDRLAKIISQGFKLESKDWLRQLDFGFVGKWSRRLLQEGNPDKQLSILAESEKAFTLILRQMVLPSYEKSSSYPISGSALMTLGKKWPRTACFIIECFPKDERHLGYIKELVPSLIDAANAHDLFSIEIYALLAATGLVAAEIPQDFQKVAELCGQLIKAGAVDAVSRVAKTLAKNELPSSFKGPMILSAKNIFLAYRLCREVLANPSTVEGIKLVEEIIDDPLFRYEVACHYQFTGEFEHALTLYADIMERVTAKTVKMNEEASQISTGGFTAYTRSMFFTKHKAILKSIIDIGPEALLRIGMVWTERLIFLNQNPSSDPKCIFNLAKHYFAQGNSDLSYRLLLNATRCVPQFWDEDLCFNLAVQFIAAGNFDKAVALLSRIPSGKNFDKAQNMLKFSGRPAEALCESMNLLEVADTPLFSRVHIIDYVLPFYRKAKEGGHKEADYLIGQLENERESLICPEQNLPKWSPSTLF